MTTSIPLISKRDSVRSFNCFIDYCLQKPFFGIAVNTQKTNLVSLSLLDLSVECRVNVVKIRLVMQIELSPTRYLNSILIVLLATHSLLSYNDLILSMSSCFLKRYFQR